MGKDLKNIAVAVGILALCVLGICTQSMAGPNDREDAKDTMLLGNTAASTNTVNTFNNTVTEDKT